MGRGCEKLSNASIAKPSAAQSGSLAGIDERCMVAVQRVCACVRVRSCRAAGQRVGGF
jgi:hypothetical protein